MAESGSFEQRLFHTSMDYSGVLSGSNNSLIGAGFEWAIHELIGNRMPEDPTPAAKLVTQRENIAREDLTTASTLDKLLRDHRDAGCADY